MQVSKTPVHVKGFSFFLFSQIFRSGQSLSENLVRFPCFTALKTEVVVRGEAPSVYRKVLGPRSGYLGPQRHHSSEVLIWSEFIVS